MIARSCFFYAEQGCVCIYYTVDENGQLRMNHAPILASARPFLGNLRHGQVQHFQQAVIGRKHQFGLGHVPQLAVKALNGIGGVDQPAHLLGILEVGAEIGPVGPPGLGDFRVFLVPALLKSVQGIQGGLLIYGCIDRLQIGHKGLQVLVGHILAGITQLVDDAVLDFGLRKGGVDGRIKSCQIVCTGAVEYSRPEFSTLIFTNPHAQDIFPSVQVDSKSDIHYRRFTQTLGCSQGRSRRCLFAVVKPSNQ